MALEFLRILRCLDYLGAGPPGPALPLKVREAAYGRTKSYTVPIDTGFSGYLLIPSEDYAQLATLELPREEFGTYLTMAGPLVLRRARAQVMVADNALETLVETPLHGGGRPLLGRRILNQLKVALLGPERMCCLVSKKAE